MDYSYMQLLCFLFGVANSQEDETDRICSIDSNNFQDRYGKCILLHLVHTQTTNFCLLSTAGMKLSCTKYNKVSISF